MLQSEVVGLIEGGGRVAVFSQDLIVTGDAYDPDVNPWDSNPYRGMKRVWRCYDLQRDIDCQDPENRTITLPRGQNSMSIAGYSLEAYKAYMISFNVTKQLRFKYSEILVIMQEIDLPLLSVYVPPELNNKVINLNDELYIEMYYGGVQDPDKLFYSAVILYKFEPVGTLIFKFLKVRFRIWEKFK